MRLVIAEQDEPRYRRLYRNRIRKEIAALREAREAGNESKSRYHEFNVRWCFPFRHAGNTERCTCVSGSFTIDRACPVHR